LIPYKSPGEHFVTKRLTSTKSNYYGPATLVNVHWYNACRSR
jgi:hypothetical protein